MYHPVITLLSDMGPGNPSVAMAKAILMDCAPGVGIFDISHNVSQYDLQQAAYLLSAACPHFPKGTVHILLVDVFRGSTHRILVAEKEGYYFIAPDNGILPLAFGDETGDTRLCFEFDGACAFKEWISKAGQVIEKIKQGNGFPAFPLCDIKKAPRILQPKVMPDGVECNILYIDHYENVTLDIKQPQFESLLNGKAFKIKISRAQGVAHISHNYNEVDKGEPLCRFNAAGYLEIALNHGKAASLLGLGAYQTGNLQYQTIKILF